ncbi:Uncharacterized protein FWK35_00022266, partial [Aphis craccivora]
MDIIYHVSDASKILLYLDNTQNACIMILFLDSERSDECIDFTMMCFFFFCLSPRFGAVKLILWGVKSKKFPIVFKSVRKNPKKVTEKREFLRKTSFRPNRFFYMVVNQKLITVYVSVIYIQLKFQKKLTFFDVDKKNLDDQKHLKNLIQGSL